MIENLMIFLYRVSLGRRCRRAGITSRADLTSLSKYRETKPIDVLYGNNADLDSTL